MGISRFLVSGNDMQLTGFYLATPMLNPIERRKQTVFFTCFDEDRESAIEQARENGVTMQELKFKGDKEIYEMIVQGDHLGWEAKK